MASNNSTTNCTLPQPQWYWLSDQPQDHIAHEVFDGGKVPVTKRQASPVWQAYSKQSNEWLEHGLSLMKQSRGQSGGYGLRIGAFCPLVNGRLEGAIGDMCVDFCNGIVTVDESHYVNINEMKQYRKHDVKRWRQVKREREYFF